MLQNESRLPWSRRRFASSSRLLARPLRGSSAFADRHPSRQRRHAAESAGQSSACLLEAWCATPVDPHFTMSAAGWRLLTSMPATTSPRRPSRPYTTSWLVSASSSAEQLTASIGCWCTLAMVQFGTQLAIQLTEKLQVLGMAARVLTRRFIRAVNGRWPEDAPAQPSPPSPPSLPPSLRCRSLCLQSLGLRADHCA